VYTESTTRTAYWESTLHDKAGTLHALAVHGIENCKKFAPKIVTVLPGKVADGKIPPKL
jgi:hypothetical protein